MVDHSLCQTVGIYSCSQASCPCRPKTFFPSQASYTRHNEEYHPPLPQPTHRSMSHPITQPPHQPSQTNVPTNVPTATPTTNTYTYTPPNNQSAIGGSALRGPQPHATASNHICETFLTSTSDSTAPNHQWPQALQFITATYDHDPPDFRTGWYKFLRNNNKRKFNELLGNIIRAILAATTTFDPKEPTAPNTINPAPF